MTVVAYRDGIMAADTSSWHADLDMGGAQKIRRFADGSLFAGCGWKPEIDCIADWLDAGMQGNRPEPAAEKDFSGLLVKRGGLIWWVTHRLAVYRSDRQDFAVLGAHTEFLYGLLLGGLSAPEAIALAIKHGQYASGEVQVMRLGGDPR